MPQTKVRESQGWFFEMQRLFKEAQYARAAHIYDSRIASGARPENDAILLRARTFLKTDSKQIVPFLLRQNLQKLTKAQQARVSMYLGTGYSRLGDFAEADRSFAEAKAVFREGPALGELAAHLTRRYLDQRDLDSASEWQKTSLVDRTLSGRIRSEHLNSYLLARRECFKEQAASITRVLDLIGDKREDFVEDWCVAVHTLAALARELVLPEAARRAKSEVDIDFEWPDDSSVRRFQALKAVAWSQALSGDELSCLRYLRQAQHINAGPIWRAILFLDRAYFASIMGDQHWAANEFASAEDLIGDVSWEETTGEERIALLLLSELATVHAPPRARFYIARFNDLGKLQTNIQHFAFDGRLKAMAAYANGVVALAAGNAITAEDELRSAWSLFDRIGYDVRAGLASLALYRATSKSRWLHLAEDKFESYPNSWLMRNFKRLATSSRLDTPRVILSKMQKAVTQLLCDGLSTEAIASQLSIRPNTVLNHLKVVYKKLGVNSRGALVAEAIKRKVVLQNDDSI
ncbi:MAG TPA: LuxR C-terminal-related transcriptional regulator [Candidatus Cybelea sp.]|jgi:DNA-binding CsgD family transcriptional regulator|nr:LuxR C-terminal-related transcriptional regulator [Candidatus Cybelea sp.]